MLEARRDQALSQERAPSGSARALLSVLLAPLIPQVIGSLFNIIYNLMMILPLLEPPKVDAFQRTVLVYNLGVYPIAMAAWTWAVLSLRPAFLALLRGEAVSPARLAWARRWLINLPWWGMGLAAAGWLLCVPVFLLALWLAPGQFDPNLFWKLPISFTLAGLFATTLSMFGVELNSQRKLFPVFFRDVSPIAVAGAHPLSVREREMLRFLTVNICPILSLLLIFAPFAVPSDDKFSGDMGSMTYIFALGVAAIWVAAGIWIKDNLLYLVLRPVEEVRVVAHRVLSGDLSARILVLRADEYGVMAEDLNEMSEGLQERQRIEETFGRHVGPQAAQWILEQDPGLGGVEAELTIFFLDIRDFTARSAVATPQQIVALLNEFLTEVVAVVDRHGGLVNKFLGDGFVALFGVLGQPDHADDAVATAREIMLHLDIINERVRRRGQAPLRIGIGIHTGRAVVGNIGSPRRTEFTALGDAVNVASRVEGLTKVVDTPVLLTAATRAALRRTFALRELPPQRVKGQPEPIPIFGLADDALPPGAVSPPLD